jgi:peptidoglycan hydrolase-like protein with peptidoglycan-binding domain
LSSDGGTSVHGSGSAPIASFSSVPSGLSGQNVTIEAWVTIPAGNVNGPIVDIGTDANGWEVGVGGTTLDNTGKQLILVTNGIAWNPSGYTFTTGTHHLMVVRGTGSAITCYVDGSSVATLSLSTPVAATSLMAVGGSASRALSSTVQVDNVALFASALSSGRVTAHYNSGSGDNAAVLADSPVAFLKFDESSASGDSGTTAADSSGNSRTLTHTNSPAFGLPSLLGDGSGYSVSYTGGSSHFSQIASASWMNTNYAAGVVRAKPSSASLSGDQYIAGRWVNGGNLSWLWYFHSGVAQIIIWAGGAQRTATGATTLTAGVNYTLGWSYDGTTLKVYVNGAVDGSSSYTGTIATGTSTLEVARAAGAVYGTVQLQGLGIFPAALSDSDHAAVHAAAIASGNDRTGTVAVTLPALTSSVTGTATPPGVTGAVAATLPSLTASAAGTVLNPVTGTVAATLPALSSSLTGTHTSNDQIGTVAATLPALTAAIVGDYVPVPVTGTVEATLPALTGSVDALTGVIGSVAATLPALSVDVVGVITITGTVAATLPALSAQIVDAGANRTGTITASLPSLTAGVVGATPSTAAGPWTADLSGRTLLPFTTSGAANSSPPLPVAPPGIVERTMYRRSKIVPDLRTIEGVIVDPTTNQLRIPDHIYDALPEVVEEVGVPHVLFRGATTSVRDVTYWRGGITKILSDRREEPFGDATFSFELPLVSSMDLWPVEDDDPLFFMINRANVYLELVKSDGSRRPIWTGHVVAHETGNSETEPTKVIQCVGSMFQAATDRMRPPPFLDPTDIGTLMSKALNGVASRRYPLLSAPATGIMSRQRGSWAESPLAYVQGLLATAWTVDGRQWTVAKVKDSVRTYEIRQKNTDPEWTVTNGARGVSVDLTRDESTIRNVIFGHGVGPDGNAWFNTHYPNLHADTAPAYPFSDPGDVISVGTTDGDTTSGHGVTDWQRRAQQLGYKLAIDGVFNTSDSKVARTIQKRYGASVDGVVGPQTWNATFAVGANGGDLSGVVRLPLAADPRTQRYVYNADGSVAGANPGFEVNVITYADDVDFGTGITRAEGLVSAQQIIDREATAGLTGRIVLTQDPVEGWRGDIAPGEKLTLVGYEGADRVLHVTAVERDWQSGAVTLDVDEKSRDAITLAQIRTRDKEARRDPARRPGNPNKRSRLDTDQVVPFDGESGAGVIPRLALYGGLWSVIRIPVSETGRVAKMHLEAGSPFAIAFFGAPVTPAHLRSYVGNPLTSDSPFQPHEAELDKLWFVEGFGQKGQRCGYYPGSEVDSNPFTGVEEQGGFEYTSNRPPWLWVAMYAASSCFLEGYIYPDTVV